MFNDEVLPHFGLVPGQLLVLVACRMGARRQGAGLALAGALAIMAEHPVLAASGDVFTTPAGAVVVREAGVAAAGQPVLAGQPAGWLLFLADQADPVVFAATDLAAVLQNRALAGELPQQAPPPRVGQHPQPPRSPAREIKWLMAPSPGRLANESPPERQPPVNAAAPGPVLAGRAITWNHSGLSSDPAVVEAPPARLPEGVAGRPGVTGVRLDQRWARNAEQWEAELDRLAGQAPPPDRRSRPAGFPRDRAEAFGEYARARLVRSAAVAVLEEFRARPGGSSGQLDGERQLLAAVAEAQRQVTLAQEWLAEWGITDARAAWRRMTRWMARHAARTSGLPGGARGRGRGQGPAAVAGARPVVVVRATVSEGPSRRRPRSGRFSEADGGLQLVPLTVQHQRHHLVAAEQEAWWRNLSRPGSRSLQGRLEDLGMRTQLGASVNLVPWVQQLLQRGLARLLAEEKYENARDTALAFVDWCL